MDLSVGDNCQCKGLGCQALGGGVTRIILLHRDMRSSISVCRHHCCLSAARTVVYSGLLIENTYTQLGNAACLVSFIIIIIIIIIFIIIIVVLPPLILGLSFTDFVIQQSSPITWHQASVHLFFFPSIHFSIHPFICQSVSKGSRNHWALCPIFDL